MAKKPGKSLVKWDEKLAELAKDSTAKMKLPTAKFMSIRGGKMTFDGADVPGNELRCVILAYTLENQFYVGKFDPKNSKPPVCYAFGTDPDEMVPHEESTDKQCGSCAECPHNEWESDPKGGKGKACKNVIRLALIAESDLDDLDKAEVVYLKIPVTSVNNFLVYAKKKIAEVLGRPFWSVITVIKVESDDDTAIKVFFERAESIDDEDLFEPLQTLNEKNMESIGFPYAAVAERESKLAAKGKTKSKFSRPRA